MELRLIGKVFLLIVGWPIVMNHEKGSELQRWTDSIDRQRVNENINSNIQTLKSTTKYQWLKINWFIYESTTSLTLTHITLYIQTNK